MKKRAALILIIIVVAGLSYGVGLGIIYYRLTIPSERELWRMTGYDISDAIVVNNLFLFQGQAIDNPDYCEYIYAVDKKTGKMSWTNENYLKHICNLSENLYTAIIGVNEAGSRILVSSDYLPKGGDREYILYALNSADGNVLWEVDGYTSYYAFYLPEYSMTEKNRLYVVDKEGSLLTIDLNTGSPIWKQETDAGDYSAHILLAGDKQMVYYYSSGNDSLLAVNAKDGSKVWRKPNLDYVDRMMFSDKLMYLVTDSTNNQGTLGSPYYVIALDIKTGNPVWKSYFGQAFHPLIEIIGDQIYIQTNQPEGWDVDYHVLNELRVVNKNTGELLWHFNENYPHGEIECRFQDNVVYVGTEDGFVLALDDKTGSTIWQTKTSGFPNHFLMAGNTLITAFKSEKYAAAFDTRTGTQKWIVDVGMVDWYDHPDMLIAEDGILLVAGTSNREVEAIDVETGKKLWSWNHNHPRSDDREYDLLTADDYVVYLNQTSSFLGKDWFFALKTMP
jgi:outer membrane protein assembly factor BamB